MSQRDGRIVERPATATAVEKHDEPAGGADHADRQPAKAARVF
jgi:hypothetical protein